MLITKLSDKKKNFLLGPFLLGFMSPVFAELIPKISDYEFEYKSNE